ncbi:MbcA/ParS/Xre antitoxin family protein [Glaciecola sp. SC05]|uniref:MbcA/ParS/Xre antitoxin family protein n=1 Tax=Glaciecola sp. SC05 TaxID=1987355 RepID=UPI003526EACE
MASSNQHIQEQSDGQIVTQAYCEAGEWLGLKREDLADIIGASVASIARYKAKTAEINDAKRMELALMLIRIYRSLFAIVGGDKAKMQHWINTDNRHLNEQTPLQLLKSIQGMYTTVRYLDAMRGRI